jgi:hypothetical protein
MRFSPVAKERLLFIGQWTLVALVAFAYVVAVTKPIILTASDLGRHLMNGKLFLDHGVILTTNEYSYTYPDFPFLNHHWGSGVFFELARRFRGFVGVSLFGLGLTLATVVLYLRIAWLHGKFWLAMTAAAIALPMFASRNEVRPELFSYLLSGVFLWILLGVRSGAVSRWALAILPVLMLAWVNLHIYFFLGVGWIGAFLVDSLVRAWIDVPNRKRHLTLASALAMTVFGCCAVAPLNPNGWKGAIYPLFIFQNYAYQVAENQTVLAIERNGPFVPGLYFKIALCVLFVSWIWRLWRDWEIRRAPDVAILILSLFVSLIAWTAIRNFAIFAYVSIVAISFAWSDVDLRARVGRWYAVVVTAVPLATLAVLVALHPGFWRYTFQTAGLGVAPNILRSVNFFKGVGLKGPIFNNYDIGGFLTYGLYPQEKTFVDNRPEAYPGEFFTNILLPMQMQDGVWAKVDAQVHFNAIFFYRHDATQWGQGFMIRRLKDPEWAPVFVDDFVLLLIRRTAENAAIIDAFELPPSMFEAVPRPKN